MQTYDSHFQGKRTSTLNINNALPGLHYSSLSLCGPGERWRIRGYVFHILVLLTLYFGAILCAAGHSWHP